MILSQLTSLLLFFSLSLVNKQFLPLTIRPWSHPLSQYTRTWESQLRSPVLSQLSSVPVRAPHGGKIQVKPKELLVDATKTRKEERNAGTNFMEATDILQVTLEIFKTSGYSQCRLNIGNCLPITFHLC